MSQQIRRAFLDEIPILGQAVGTLAGVQRSDDILARIRYFQQPFGIFVEWRARLDSNQ